MAESTGNKFTSDSRGEPPPRERYQPESVPTEEPGFYIVERSQLLAELYRSLFDAMPGCAMRLFSELNPGLNGSVEVVGELLYEAKCP